MQNLLLEVPFAGVAQPYGKTQWLDPCLQGAEASATNDQEQTPLYKAVEAKQAAAAQALSHCGPQAVNNADEWGLTPLHIAARAGNADIVTLLLMAQVRTTSGQSAPLAVTAPFTIVNLEPRFRQMLTCTRCAGVKKDLCTK